MTRTAREYNHPSSSRRRGRRPMNFSAFWNVVVAMLVGVLSSLLLCSQQQQAQSFLLVTPVTRRPCPSTAHRQLSMNFFKDMLDNAFANDPTLSKSDVKDGSIDAALYDDDQAFARRRSATTATTTQQQWREAQSRIQSQARGAPLSQPSILEHTKWSLDLYLSGIPSKDPSNDLYGARTNISTRNENDGMDLPEEPSVSSVGIEFLPDGVCQVLSESPFTTTEKAGEWKLSDDGRMVRFSMHVLGYSRTVQTKGTITNVFWSDRDEISTSTSTSYTIPPGILFCDISVGYGSKPGTLQMPNRGVLRVEKTMGLLGAASKMVPCGQVEAKQILEESM